MKQVSRYSSLQVEEYIANTVQSVLKQTYQNFELLIIDESLTKV